MYTLVYAQQIIMNNLWFKMDAVTSEDQPRLHHQLVPNTLRYEKNFDQVMIRFHPRA